MRGAAGKLEGVEGQRAGPADCSAEGQREEESSHAGTP
jgi:hypothetical protein